MQSKGPQRYQFQSSLSLPKQSRSSPDRQSCPLGDKMTYYTLSQYGGSLQFLSLSSWGQPHSFFQSIHQEGRQQSLSLTLVLQSGLQIWLILYLSFAEATDYINLLTLSLISEMPGKVDKAVIGTAVTSGTAAVTAGGLTAAGFTSSGIAASSVAAGIQAGTGNVVAGSIFATLQSLGATGVIATVGTVGGIGLGVAGVYGGYKLYQKLKAKPKI